MQKYSVVSLDYQRETKLRYTEAKIRKKFKNSKKRSHSKNKSNKKVVEKKKK